MQHFETEAVKAHKAKQEALKATVIYLGKLASLLRSRHFARWYADSSSRFPWAGVKLDAKLRRDLMFQVNQGLDRDKKDLSELGKLKLVGEYCNELITEIESKVEGKVTAKEKRFQLNQDDNPSQVIFDFLSLHDTSRLVRDQQRSFYLWNSISSLVIFARAQDTLKRTTGNDEFESILSGLVEEYLLDGYPHDLLAHDAHAFRTGVNVKALLIRESYCSTYLVKDGQSIEAQAEFRTVNFKKNVKPVSVRAAG